MPIMSSYECPNCRSRYVYALQPIVTCVDCGFVRATPQTYIERKPGKGGTVRSEQDYSHSP